MNIRLIITILSISYMGTFASETITQTVIHNNKKQISTKTNVKRTQKNWDLKITIKGIVCAFCSQGLKKAFLSHQSVQSAVVNLENKTVKIKLKPKKILNNPTVHEIVKNAGYSVEQISRSNGSQATPID